jgi:pilus assembly protein CpaB
MSRSRFVRTILVPLIIGGLATALVAWYIQGEEQRLAPKDLMPLVVAVRPVPAKSVLLPDMLALTHVPRAYPLPNALTRIEDAVGKVTTVMLAEGEPLFASRIVPKDVAIGLSHYIPDGYRAVTISVNEIIGVAAFAEPGDRVDILASFGKDLVGYEQTHLILENVQVLAVVRELESRGTQQQKDLRQYTSVTLAVNPEQAAVLVWSEEYGRLRLLLRPEGSSDTSGKIEANAEKVTGHAPE